MRQYLTLILMLMLALMPAAAQDYSWNQMHAKVIETGDLEWNPRPFTYHEGQEVRYIDFVGGNDSNPGTKKAPWQHHPWDPNASGLANACDGVKTYVFKGGVTYRGILVAEESGTEQESILLTCDPDWGDGKAVIQGSDAIDGGWVRGSVSTAENIPEPELVWYVDIGTEYTPRMLWALQGDKVKRIPLARDPNWEEESIDDTRSQWYMFKESSLEEDPDGNHIPKVYDPENLTAEEPDAYEGATLWSEYAHLMGTPYAQKIGLYNPQENSLVVEPVWGPSPQTAERWVPRDYSRYFLENLPEFLDSPGEWYYAAEGKLAGRLFLRLPSDANPNHMTIEVARHLSIIRINDQSNIEISNIEFRFQNAYEWSKRFYEDFDVVPAFVSIIGNASNITVANCRFLYGARAVKGYAFGPHDLQDNMTVKDCEMLYLDQQGILFRDGASFGVIDPPMGNTQRVRIMRNRLYDIGARPERGESSHAILIESATLIEVAGNIVDKSYGSGIHVFNGKGHDLRNKPLIRNLIYNNKVTNSLLHSNDWGGIEIWRGGPCYVYNNISGNPGGYWHWRHVTSLESDTQRTHMDARFGFAYYLDSQFKSYLFNNIAWGNENDLLSPLANSAAVQETVGFLNLMFHNTIWNFGVGFRNQPVFFERDFYMANVIADCSEFFIDHNALKTQSPFDYSTLAYRDNVMYGNPRAPVRHATNPYEDFETVEAFAEHMQKEKALASSVGVLAEKQPLRNPEKHDFRLAPDSAAIDRGIKFFVPWGLYGVVGEWNFYHNKKDPSRIFGENMYYNDEYLYRAMYKVIPRNDLTAVNVGHDNYENGLLENWVKGALHFNGNDAYCVYPHKKMIESYSWNTYDGEEIVYDGSKRKTVNIGKENFLIELVMRAEKSNAVLVEKKEENGYQLKIDQEGYPVISLFVAGQSIATGTGKTKIADGQWHHVIAEVDRSAEEGLSIYIDGKEQSAKLMGKMPDPEISLANEADFYVGRDGEGSKYYTGSIDFLRVSQGTLADAKTTIDELYTWEFDGPQLRDFAGHTSTGKGRDAGALELTK